jgi:hypothetical protein
MCLKGKHTVCFFMRNTPLGAMVLTIPADILHGCERQCLLQLCTTQHSSSVCTVQSGAVIK